ncbi:MAG: cyclase family protein, partial [Flavobacteriia bacterium]
MIFYLDPQHFIDTSAPIDLSLALSASPDNPRAWYVDAPRMEPVRANGFIGSVAEGGAVNFRDVFFNPHGHGTHTESYG